MIPGKNSTEKKARERVYICSPYKVDGDPDSLTSTHESNISRAKAYAEYAIACGLAPSVPHLYIPNIIGDLEARETGLECSCSLVIGCKQIWVCTEEQSEGMRREVETARRYGVEVVQAWQDAGAAIYLAKWGL